MTPAATIPPDDAGELLLIGLFVGGASRRMGTPKGLLKEPRGDRTLLERLLDETRHAFPLSPVVLVGRRPEYESLGLLTLDDARPESGPLGGLVALLEQAKRNGQRAVIAMACDLPRLGASFLCRLASIDSEAPAVAPWMDGRWQPLVARYAVTTLEASRRALSEGRLALQPLLTELGCVRIEPSESERAQLMDWDRPSDVDRESEG